MWECGTITASIAGMYTGVSSCEIVGNSWKPTCPTKIFAASDPPGIFLISFLLGCKRSKDFISNIYLAMISILGTLSSVLRIL